MSTTTHTDLGIGLGLLFSLIAVGAAVATAVLGFDYAVLHAAGESARGTQITAGLAFGLSMLAAALAVVAVHVYE